VITVAIQQSILQGQGIGTQIGGVSSAQTQYVQQQVAYQAEQRQQTNGGGGGGGGGGFGSTTPTTTPFDLEPLAWLLLGLM